MFDLLATVPYYTAYLSRALIDAGANVSIASITYYLDPTCFSSRGLTTSPGALDVVGRFHLPRVLRRVLKLAESVINLLALALQFALVPPDILHIQYLPLLRWPMPLDLWLARFARWRGVKLVLTVHDLLPHDTAGKFQAIFTRLYNSVDGLICHSASVEARLIGEFHVSPALICVIPHGPFFYDVPSGNSDTVLPSFGVPTDAALVLWQGLVFPYKGVDLLLDAWQEVERAHPGAYLVVAGTGEPGLLLALQQQVKALGLQHVTLHQQFITTEQLAALYRAAEIVVYPYRAITTSGALATGLSFGKTLLATNLPVFQELLEDNVSALLVEPEKNVLSSALIRLLSDPELRKSFSDKIAALQFGESSWKRIATETLSAYNRATASLHE